MELTLAYSPCPNDTFIFDALVHHKIDTEGLTFKVQLADVEALNQKAFSATTDITKISYHAYFYVTEQYVLLDSGSALGNQCGPLVISPNVFPANELIHKIIAIPGKYTTANFLLQYFLSQQPNFKPQTGRHIAMLFSEIMPAVQKGKVDAGVIIHENRFTYLQHGLSKIIDLGDFWETQTGFPIPLGGIIAKRNLPKEVLQTLNRVLHRSIAYAMQNPEQTMGYVRTHAQEMEDTVMKQHIELYVNQYTLSLGEIGKAAIHHMHNIGAEAGFLPVENSNLFLI